MTQPESFKLAFANTGEQYLEHLILKLNEIGDKALEYAVDRNYIRIIERSGVHYQSIANILTSEEGKYVTMLHYSGHSTSEGLIIHWKNEMSGFKTELILALIRIHKKFRFVFLNSCFSKDIALELLKAGVSHFIGTTDLIDDRQAAIVAGQFYYFLSKSNKTINDAFILTKNYFRDASYKDNAGIRKRSELSI